MELSKRNYHTSLFLPPLFLLNLTNRWSLLIHVRWGVGRLPWVGSLIWIGILLARRWLIRRSPRLLGRHRGTLTLRRCGVLHLLLLAVHLHSGRRVGAWKFSTIYMVSPFSEFVHIVIRVKSNIFDDITRMEFFIEADFFIHKFDENSRNIARTTLMLWKSVITNKIRKITTSICCSNGEKSNFSRIYYIL